MIIIHKLIYNFVLRILKFYDSKRIDTEMIFISKIVDLGNHLLGRGAGSIQPPDEVRRLKYFLSEIDIAIDIGANSGIYSLELLKEFEVKELHMFEPLTAGFEFLKKNFALNSSIHVINKGLSDKNESIKIFYETVKDKEKIIPNASVYKRSTEYIYDKTQNENEIVHLIKFDEYWQNQLDSRIIDFIKIDTEGHEFKCLMGAKEAVKSTKVIQFEFGNTMVAPRLFFLDFYNFFTNLDFQIYRMRPNGLYTIKKYKYKDEHFGYSNFLAVNTKLITLK